MDSAAAVFTHLLDDNDYTNLDVPYDGFCFYYAALERPDPVLAGPPSCPTPLGHVVLSFGYVARSLLLSSGSR